MESISSYEQVYRLYREPPREMRMEILSSSFFPEIMSDGSVLPENGREKMNEMRECRMNQEILLCTASTFPES